MRHSGTLRRKSLNLGRNLAGSVGGFLPGAVTGMWDPQRDFAFLKLPTAGVRSVVALSSFVPSFLANDARRTTHDADEEGEKQYDTSSHGRYL